MPPQPSDANKIAAAVEVLRRGGLVAMPTETVYGLAGDALNPVALARIFEVKERPSFDPLICHAPSLEVVLTLVASFPAAARELAERFWPGPLTLVLPKQLPVPDLATSGLPNVAVRVPAHPLAQELLHAFGGPLAAPSANMFGRISPTTADAVRQELGDRVDLILDGGPCSVGVESTVVGFGPTAEGEESPARVLRTGGITVEEIENVLGPVEVVTAGSSRPDAPGQLASHYAPRKPLTLLPVDTPLPAETATVGLLYWGEESGVGALAASRCLSPGKNLREAAANLFRHLRELDQEPEVQRLLARPVPEEGLGRAINDRLRRAAA